MPAKENPVSVSNEPTDPNRLIIDRIRSHCLTPNENPADYFFEFKLLSNWTSKFLVTKRRIDPIKPNDMSALASTITSGVVVDDLIVASSRYYHPTLYIIEHRSKWFVTAFETQNRDPDLPLSSLELARRILMFKDRTVVVERILTGLLDGKAPRENAYVFIQWCHEILSEVTGAYGTDERLEL